MNLWPLVAGGLRNYERVKMLRQDPICQKETLMSPPPLKKNKTNLHFRA